MREGILKKQIKIILYWINMGTKPINRFQRDNCEYKWIRGQNV